MNLQTAPCDRSGPRRRRIASDLSSTFHFPPEMRFNFDLAEPDDRQSPTPSPSSSTPKAELQWFPLQNHPLFSSATATATPAAAERMPPNLMAWDGASRLYFWDLNKKCLHRISIRLGEPDPTSILAASPSKVFPLFLLFWILMQYVCFVCV